MMPGNHRNFVKIRKGANSCGYHYPADERDGPFSSRAFFIACKLIEKGAKVAIIRKN
jgi:hypothetical protein